MDNTLLKAEDDRFEAMIYLADNLKRYDDWKEGTDFKFKNWRFVRLLDDDVYFANCISRGISFTEFVDYNLYCMKANRMIGIY